MPLLQFRALSKKYDDELVLSDISMSVHKGEWVGIVGESGSGKSTLLKILGRFLDADQGEVFLKGEKLPFVREQLLKGHELIRLVHQEYELFPNQTARENIAYALRFYTPEYQHFRVDELLQLTRLTDAEHRKAKLLSGGEKQRTALAQAIAIPPDLLLLDEPFAHLDPKNKQTLAEAIESLKKTNKLTCLFVTHDASEALAWADRIVILKEGKIIQQGTPEQIYTYPANVYVAQLTGLVNLVEQYESGKVLMIRPNFIRTVRNEDKATWKAFITQIRFKGGYYENYCTTVEGQSLIYFSGRKQREVGETVFLTYSPRHSRIYDKKE